MAKRIQKEEKGKKISVVQENKIKFKNVHTILSKS